MTAGQEDTDVAEDGGLDLLLQCCDSPSAPLSKVESIVIQDGRMLPGVSRATCRVFRIGNLPELVMVQRGLGGSQRAISTL